jgi:flagellar protein FlbD
VILLTRLGGAPFALNPDLVERADCTPDTVITLVDGTKYVVAESLPELIDLVLGFRAAVVSTAQRLTEAIEATESAEPVRHPARPRLPTAGSIVVPLHRREH